MFRAEIEKMEYAAPVVAGARPARPSLDAIVAVARTRHPTAEPRALRIPTEPGQPYRVELLAGHQPIAVAVDPRTLQAIGERAAERSLMVPVRSLHATLHGGRLGAVGVGFLGLWLVVESVTGLWLCWPSVRRRPRAISMAPSEGALGRGLHRLVGGLSVALGVIVALTGTALALESVFTLADASASPARNRGELSRLDTIAVHAETALPGARITALIDEADDMIRVETTAGSVIVDRETRSVARAPADRTRFTAWE